ncbi:MAG: hypothetical protein K8E66_12720, partial [Phycisphaerales bacterium]|nr:hypothetical protein [Phycisphaerales bacterium]
ASINVGAQGFGLAVVGGVEAIVSACNAADLAEPLGVLDLADVTMFASGFGSQAASSDLVEDTVFDLADINAFVSAFLSGCGGE